MEDLLGRRAPFMIQMRRGRDCAILILAGEFDTCACPRFRKGFEGLRRSGVERVLIDLEAVRFLSSTALSAIIESCKKIVAQGGTLVVSRPTGLCREVIRTIGLERLVPIFETKGEALQYLHGRTRATRGTGTGAQGS